MLSDNLKQLFDDLAKYSGGPVTIEAPALTSLLLILDCAIEDARALEHQVVPEPARRHPSTHGGNVVDLDAFRPWSPS